MAENTKPTDNQPTTNNLSEDDKTKQTANNQQVNNTNQNDNTNTNTSTNSEPETEVVDVFSDLDTEMKKTLIEYGQRIAESKQVRPKISYLLGESETAYRRPLVDPKLTEPDYVYFNTANLPRTGNVFAGTGVNYAQMPLEQERLTGGINSRLPYSQVMSILAQNQSGWEKAGRSLLAFQYGTLGGIFYSLGDWPDMVNKLVTGQRTYENILYKAADMFMDLSGTQTQRIYSNTDNINDLTDLGNVTKIVSSMGLTFGFAAEAFFETWVGAALSASVIGAPAGAGIAASGVRKLSTVGKIVKAIEASQKASKIARYGKASMSLIIARNHESMMESRETYKEVYDSLVSQNIATQTADKIARTAAHKDYIWNMYLLAFDFMSLGLMKFPTAPYMVGTKNFVEELVERYAGKGLGSTLVNFGINSVSNGIEEGLQEMASFNSKWQAKWENGIPVFAGENVWKNAEVWNNALAGLLTGPISEIMIDKAMHAGEKKMQAAYNKRYDLETAFSYGQRLNYVKQINEELAKENPDYDKINRARVKLSQEIALENMRRDLLYGKEDLDSFRDYRDYVKETLKELKDAKEKGDFSDLDKEGFKEVNEKNIDQFIDLWEKLDKDITQLEKSYDEHKDKVDIWSLPTVVEIDFRRKVADEQLKTLTDELEQIKTKGKKDIDDYLEIFIEDEDERNKVSLDIVKLFDIAEELGQLEGAKRTAKSEAEFDKVPGLDKALKDKKEEFERLVDSINKKLREESGNEKYDILKDGELDEVLKYYTDTLSKAIHVKTLYDKKYSIWTDKKHQDHIRYISLKKLRENARKAKEKFDKEQEDLKKNHNVKKKKEGGESETVSVDITEEIKDATKTHEKTSEIAEDMAIELDKNPDDPEGAAAKINMKGGKDKLAAALTADDNIVKKELDSMKAEESAIAQELKQEAETLKEVADELEVEDKLIKEQMEEDDIFMKYIEEELKKEQQMLEYAQKHGLIYTPTEEELEQLKKKREERKKKLEEGKTEETTKKTEEPEEEGAPENENRRVYAPKKLLKYNQLRLKQSVANMRRALARKQGIPEDEITFDQLGIELYNTLGEKEFDEIYNALALGWYLLTGEKFNTKELYDFITDPIRSESTSILEAIEVSDEEEYIQLEEENIDDTPTEEEIKNAEEEKVTVTDTSTGQTSPIDDMLLQKEQERSKHTGSEVLDKSLAVTDVNERHAELKNKRILTVPSDKGVKLDFSQHISLRNTDGTYLTQQLGYWIFQAEDLPEQLERLLKENGINATGFLRLHSVELEKGKDSTVSYEITLKERFELLNKKIENLLGNKWKTNKQLQKSLSIIGKELGIEREEFVKWLKGELDKTASLDIFDKISNEIDSLSESQAINELSKIGARIITYGIMTDSAAKEKLNWILDKFNESHGLTINKEYLFREVSIDQISGQEVKDFNEDHHKAFIIGINRAEVLRNGDKVSEGDYKYVVGHNEEDIYYAIENKRYGEISKIIGKAVKDYYKQNIRDNLYQSLEKVEQTEQTAKTYFTVSVNNNGTIKQFRLETSYDEGFKLANELLRLKANPASNANFNFYGYEHLIFQGHASEDLVNWYKTSKAKKREAKRPANRKGKTIEEHTGGIKIVETPIKTIISDPAAETSAFDNELGSFIFVSNRPEPKFEYKAIGFDGKPIPTTDTNPMRLLDPDRYKPGDEFYIALPDNYEDIVIVYYRHVKDKNGNIISVQRVTGKYRSIVARYGDEIKAMYGSLDAILPYIVYDKESVPVALVPNVTWYYGIGRNYKGEWKWHISDPKVREQGFNNIKRIRRNATKHIMQTDKPYKIKLKAKGGRQAILLKEFKPVSEVIDKPVTAVVSIESVNGQEKKIIEIEGESIEVKGGKIETQNAIYILPNKNLYEGNIIEFRLHSYTENGKPIFYGFRAKRLNLKPYVANTLNETLINALHIFSKARYGEKNRGKYIGVGKKVGIETNPEKTRVYEDPTTGQKHTFYDYGIDTPDGLFRFLRQFMYIKVKMINDEVNKKNIIESLRINAAQEAQAAVEKLLAYRSDNEKESRIVTYFVDNDTLVIAKATKGKDDEVSTNKDDIWETTQTFVIDLRNIDYDKLSDDLANLFDGTAINIDKNAYKNSFVTITRQYENENAEEDKYQIQKSSIYPSIEDVYNEHVGTRISTVPIKIGKNKSKKVTFIQPQYYFTETEVQDSYKEFEEESEDIEPIEEEPVTVRVSTDVDVSTDSDVKKETKESATNNATANPDKESKISKMIENLNSFEDSNGLFAPIIVKNNELKSLIEEETGLKNIPPNMIAEVKNSITGLLFQAIDDDTDFETFARETSEKIVNTLIERLEKLESDVNDLEKELNASINEISKKTANLAKIKINNARFTIEKMTLLIENFDTLFEDIMEDLKLKYNVAVSKEDEAITDGVNEIDYDDQSELDDQSEETTNVENRNFYKTKLQENPKKTLPYSVKRMMTSIMEVDDDGKPVKGLLGLPKYISFDEVYDTVISILTQIPSPPRDFETMMSMLWQRVEDFPWLEQLITKLENMPEHKKNMFVTVMGKWFYNAVSPKYKHGKKGGMMYVFKTSRNAMADKIMEIWETNYNSLFTYEDGLYYPDNERLKELVEEYDRIVGNTAITNSTEINYITSMYVEGTSERIFTLSYRGNEDKQIIYGKREFFNALDRLAKRRKIDASINTIKQELEKNKEIVLYGSARNKYKLTLKGDEIIATKFKVDAQQFHSWLNKVGVEVSLKTVEHIINYGLKVKTSREGYNRLSMDYLVAGSGDDAVFNYLRKELYRLSVAREGLKYTSPPFRSNMFFWKIARLDATQSDTVPPTSFIDGGKNIYAPQDTNLAVDNLAKLKRGDQNYIEGLRNTHYAGKSIILDLLDNAPISINLIDMEEISVNAIGIIGQKNIRDTNLFNLSPGEIDMLKLILFQAGEETFDYTDEKTGLPMRVARIGFPAISDKERLPVLKTPVFLFNQFESDWITFGTQEKEDSNGRKVKTYYLHIGPKMLNLIKEYTVENELDRILTAYTSKEYDKLDGFKDGAKLFHGIWELNTVEINSKNIHTFIEESLATGKDVKWIKEQILNNENTDRTINYFMQDMVLQTYTYLKKIGYIDKRGRTMFGSYYKKIFLGNMPESIGTALVMTADFVINNFLYLSEISKIFGQGDVAAYTVINPEIRKQINENGLGSLTREQWEQISIDTLNNMDKRTAMLLAPGSRQAGSDNKSFMQVFAEDYRFISDGLEYLINIHYPEIYSQAKDDIRILIDEAQRGNKDAEDKLLTLFPELKPFINFEATDSQEYMTPYEYITNMFEQGKLDRETYDRMVEKIKKRVEFEMKHPDDPIPQEYLFSQEEIDKIFYGVFQPLKQVYTSVEQNGHILQPTYLKFATITLMPEFGNNMAITKLRRAMEQLEYSNNYSYPVRLVFGSGAKVGAPTKKLSIQDSKGRLRDISKNEMLAHARIMRRDGLRLQQEFPHKEHNLVSLGTQLAKLIENAPDVELTRPQKKSIKKPKPLSHSYIGKIQSIETYEAKDVPIKIENIDGEQIDYFGKYYVVTTIDGKQFLFTYNFDTVSPEDVIKYREFLAFLEKNNAYDYQSEVEKVQEDNTDIKKTGETVKDVVEDYIKTFKKLTNINKIHLDLRFGIYGDWIDIERFRREFINLMKKEAKLRGYSSQDIKAINAYVIKKNGRHEIAFDIPLWLLPSAKKFEALLISIARKNMVKLKFPGFSFQNTSGAMFQEIEKAADKMKRYSSIEEMEKETGQKNVRSQIIYTKHWNGKLRGIRKSGYPQVLVPHRFRTADGQLIDLYATDENGNFKYIEIKNGKYYLKDDAISDELLTLISFRIPTSGLVSAQKVEIAGFLPESAGDIIVVHPDIQVKEGSDYDGDKEFTYWKHIYIDENGNIKAYHADIEKNEQRLVNAIKATDKIAKQLIKITDRIAQINSDIEEAEKLGDTDAISSLVAVGTKLERRYKQLQKELTGHREEINRIYEKLTRIYQNRIIDHYHKIFGSKNPEIERLINKALEFDTEKKTSYIIERMQHDESMVHSPFNVAFHTKKLTDAAVGKSAIGIYSIALTTYAMMKKDHYKLRTVDSTEPIKISFGYDAKGRLLESDTIGRYKTVDGERLVQETFESLQNTATDEAKEGVLARANINDYTINLHVALALMGFDRATVYVDGKEETVHLPYLLTSQKIIKDFVTRVSNKKTMFISSAGYHEFNTLKEMYREVYGEDPEWETIDDAYAEFVNNELENSKTITFDAQTLLDKINTIDEETFATLVKFVFLKNNLANMLSDVIIPLSANSSFKSNFSSLANIEEKMTEEVGGMARSKYLAVDGLKEIYTEFDDREEVNWQDAIERPDAIEYTGTKYELDEEGNLHKEEKLLKSTTLAAHQMLKAIEWLRQRFDGHFAATNEAIRRIYQVILRNSGMGKVNVGKFERLMSSELMKYIYAAAIQRFVKERHDVNSLRKKYLFDFKGNQSLASYLNELKRSGHKIMKNDLLSKLDLKIRLGEPSTIEVAGGLDTIAKDLMYQDFLKMLADLNELPPYNYDNTDYTELEDNEITDAIKEAINGKTWFVIGKQGISLDAKAKVLEGYTHHGKFEYAGKKYKIAIFGHMTYEQAKNMGYKGPEFAGRRTIYKVEPFYTVKDLAIDLIMYTLLTEPNNYMLSLAEYIPLSFISNTEIGRFLRTLRNEDILSNLLEGDRVYIGQYENRNGNTVSHSIPSFVVQFFQHNPRAAIYASEKMLRDIDQQNREKLAEGHVKSLQIFAFNYANGEPQLHMWTENEGWVILPVAQQRMINAYDPESKITEPITIDKTKLEHKKELMKAYIDRLSMSDNVLSVISIMEDIAELNGLKDTNSYVLLNELANMIMNNRRVNTNVAVKLVDNVPYAASYNPKTNVLEINKDYLRNKPDELMATVAHEILHKLTVNKLHKRFAYDENGYVIITDKMPKYAKDLAEVYNRARKAIEEELSKKIPGYEKWKQDLEKRIKGGSAVLRTAEEVLYYYVMNMDEFISGVMTEPILRDKLNSIKDEEGITLWDRIVLAIKKLLETMGVKKNTLLYSSVEAVMAYIEKSMYVDNAKDLGTINGVKVYLADQVIDKKGKHLYRNFIKIGDEWELYMSEKKLRELFDSGMIYLYDPKSGFEIAFDLSIFNDEENPFQSFIDFMAKYYVLKNKLTYSDVATKLGKQHITGREYLEFIRDKALDKEEQFESGIYTKAQKTEVYTGKAVISDKNLEGKFVRVEAAEPKSQRDLKILTSEKNKVLDFEHFDVFSGPEYINAEKEAKEVGLLGETKIKKIKKWTRKQVEEDKDSVYLFGDNLQDAETGYVPRSTQAVIRGLENAIGIPTKKNRGRSKDSYFSDKDFDLFKEKVDQALDKARKLAQEGKTIVLPQDGIGTGAAHLQEKAPKLFEYLQNELAKLEEELKSKNKMTDNEANSLATAIVYADAFYTDNSKLAKFAVNVLKNQYYSDQGFETQIFYKKDGIWYKYDFNRDAWVKLHGSLVIAKTSVILAKDVDELYQNTRKMFNGYKKLYIRVKPYHTKFVKSAHEYKNGLQSSSDPEALAKSVGYSSSDDLAAAHRSFAEGRRAFVNMLEEPEYAKAKAEVITTVSPFTNWSGGAAGADSVWDEVGRRYGVKDHRHFYVSDPQEKGNVKLSSGEYKKAESLAHAIAIAINRKWSKSKRVRELVTRDIYQALNAEAVFAVSPIDRLSSGAMMYIKNKKGLEIVHGNEHSQILGYNARHFEWRPGANTFLGKVLTENGLEDVTFTSAMDAFKATKLLYDSRYATIKNKKLVINKKGKELIRELSKLSSEVDNKLDDGTKANERFDEIISGLMPSEDFEIDSRDIMTELLADSWGNNKAARLYLHVYYNAQEVKKITYEDKLINSDKLTEKANEIVEADKEEFNKLYGDRNKFVKGGTAYAVEMAKLLGKDIYVFDYKQTNVWYKWSYKEGKFVKVPTPTLTKNFAGIGTRDVKLDPNDPGYRAIENVYKKSLGIGKVLAPKKEFVSFNADQLLNSPLSKGDMQQILETIKHC